MLAPCHDAAGVRPPQLRHSVEADTKRPVAGDPARHTQLVARHLSTESLTGCEKHRQAVQHHNGLGTAEYDLTLIGALAPRDDSHVPASPLALVYG